MQGYFDLHSHILPGVDDGSKDMEETRRMLLIAYEEGIRNIVATPHYRVGGNNVAVASLKAIYEEVNQIAEGAAKEFHILLGNELLYSSGVIEALKKGEALTIDGTRYILVEFAPGTAYREIRDGLNNCIYAGYIPILAHAERYHCLVKDYFLVRELIKLGVYIQLNYSSLRGKIYDQKVKFCQRLLKKEWVHFIGTDAHGAYERIPHIKEAVAFIKRKYGENAVRQLLWENPMILLEDKHL
jgi:protein-tyrosine phosphatase